MHRLLSSSPRKLLLIALLLLLVVRFSSQLPDGLEFVMEKLGIKQEDAADPQHND
ncbi:MAG: hypothetical protein VCA55_15250 [Verrucomicrobiales bacterium]